MKPCGYVMCDGYDCHENGLVLIGNKWYCSDHAIAMDIGIDPMTNE